MRRFGVFRRIVFPNLLPAILSGIALAFARAVGEFGAVVLISGNNPFRTEVSAVYIFGRIQSGDTHAAAVLSVILLAISFAVLLGIGGLRRFATRHDREQAERRPIRLPLSLLYLLAILLAPVGLIFWRTFEHGLRPVWIAISQPDAVHALWLTVAIALVAVPLNTSFGVLCALAIVRHRFRGVGLVNALVDRRRPGSRRRPWRRDAPVHFPSRHRPKQTCPVASHKGMSVCALPVASGRCCAG